MVEMEMQGVLAGNAIEGIKLGKLPKGNAGPQERFNIELLESQVDVDASKDPVKELLQSTHIAAFLFDLTRGRRTALIQACQPLIIPLDRRRYFGSVTGIPIIGQITMTKIPSTTSKMTLAMAP